VTPEEPRGEEADDPRPPERSDDPDLDDLPPTEHPHVDDGLDLARRTARSVAGSGALPRRAPKRRRPGTSGGRPAPGDDRDPQLLDSTLSRLVSDHGWALDLRVRGVFARWPEIVGAEVAAHTAPETFTDGRLVVRTDSTAWATQLRLLAPQLVQRLNEDLGAGTVTLIEVLGPHLPTWRKGPRSTRDGRGPRDTYG
jgi:predicted nucleic acid-binding Zn ribbon protein